MREPERVRESKRGQEGVRKVDGLTVNQKDYLHAAVLCFGKPHSFINIAVRIKWRYIILHFMLIFCLLFIPVFASVVRTQPDQLYTRMFSQTFENASMKHHNTESFLPEKITDDLPAIFVFNNFLVYADSNIVLSAPVELFTFCELSLPFGEVFSMIAVYNMYIPQFLLPMLLIVFITLLVLQFFFFLVSGVFLGAFRFTSSSLPFGEKVRIVIMASLFPALIGAAVGFLLPVVHIILFQMINLFLLFFLSKKLLLSEESDNT